jgi:hypothetical protein
MANHTERGDTAHTYAALPQLAQGADAPGPHIRLPRPGLFGVDSATPPVSAQPALTGAQSPFERRTPMSTQSMTRGPAVITIPCARPNR